MQDILEKAQALAATTSDTKEFSSLYDELLWAIVSASAEELAEAGSKIYDAPLLNTPRPLQVALLRLAALTSSDNASKENLLSLLASLCDPLDEQVIVSPIRKTVG